MIFLFKNHFNYVCILIIKKTVNYKIKKIVVMCRTALTITVEILRMNTYVS